MNSAVFDIETSALEGIGAGVLLCVCVRPLSTNRTRTFRLDGYEYKPDNKFGIFQREEKALLGEAFEELRKYDLLIGQNIENFDLGFLKTRAYRHSVPFMLSPLTYDTMRAFGRTRLRTVINFNSGKPSKSLDMIADLLGIEQEKTKLYPAHHWQTIWGNKQERITAMNDLVDHCVRDVSMNARVYRTLLDIDTRVTMKRWL